MKTREVILLVVFSCLPFLFIYLICLTTWFNKENVKFHEILNHCHLNQNNVTLTKHCMMLFALFGNLSNYCFREVCYAWYVIDCQGVIITYFA